MSGDLQWMGAADAARAIVTRELSPVELTRTLLERIERLDPKLNVFIRLDADDSGTISSAVTARAIATVALGGWVTVGSSSNCVTLPRE